MRGLVRPHGEQRQRTGGRAGQLLDAASKQDRPLQVVRMGELGPGRSLSRYEAGAGPLPIGKGQHVHD
jgi:hypothetical protein